MFLHLCFFLIFSTYFTSRNLVSLHPSQHPFTHLILSSLVIFIFLSILTLRFFLHPFPYFFLYLPHLRRPTLSSSFSASLHILPSFLSSCFVLISQHPCPSFFFLHSLICSSLRFIITDVLFPHPLQHPLTPPYLFISCYLQFLWHLYYSIIHAPCSPLFTSSPTEYSLFFSPLSASLHTLSFHLPLSSVSLTYSSFSFSSLQCPFLFFSFHLRCSLTFHTSTFLTLPFLFISISNLRAFCLPHIFISHDATLSDLT